MRILFALSETDGENEKPVFRKHHLNLVKELEEGNLAKVHLSEKLQIVEFIQWNQELSACLPVSRVNCALINGRATTG